MGNKRAGLLVLLTAACMLAAPSGIAAADGAGADTGIARHGAADIRRDAQGHDRAGTEQAADRPVTHLLVPPSDATSPSQYAQLTFDAWVRADSVELRKQGTGGVTDMLVARPWSWDDEWQEEKDCEGAAGSTYCTWTGGPAQLTLRVANQKAVHGQPHAVTEAVLEPMPGDTVALWPLTTQEQADNSQDLVDQGHSPWMLYPDTVATSYAEAEIGWDNPRVSAEGKGVFRITDHATAASMKTILGQPARTGDGGIWAVTSLRSAGG